MTMSSLSGEVSESAEGARLLSEYTGLNLYRGFKSLPLRQKSDLYDPATYLSAWRDLFFYFL